MKRFALLFAALLLGVMAVTACSGEKGSGNATGPGYEVPDDITVTGEATDVTEWSAKISASSHIPEGVLYFKDGIILSKQDKPFRDPEAIVLEGKTNGEYSFQATELSSDATYYFQSFVTIGLNQYFGEVKSFQTKTINATVNVGGISFKMADASFTASVQVEGAGILPVNVYFVWAFSETGALTLDQLKTGGDYVHASLEEGVARAALLPVVDGKPTGRELFFNGHHSYAVCVKVWDKPYYTSGGNTPIWVTQSRPVDLGLSVKWDNAPLQGYYAWGEPNPKETFTGTNYMYAATPAKLPLDSDAAHIHLGGHWRMPTAAEFKELLDKTEVNYFGMYRDIRGRLFIGKNGNSIFFPARGVMDANGLGAYNASGWYWSSTLEVDWNLAEIFSVAKSSAYVGANGAFPRWNGMNIYAVYDENTH